MVGPVTVAAPYSCSVKVYPSGRLDIACDPIVCHIVWLAMECSTSIFPKILRQITPRRSPDL
jgi:hypothetical protein